MARLLMPQATAVWLVENTVLTFAQIAAFCGLHDLEVQAIADGEVAVGINGVDPTANGQLTREEIARCEASPEARLELATYDLPKPLLRSKGPRYTPLAKRAEKPDAIAWCLKHHPELSEAQMIRLIGTTRQTISAVRERTHWNYSNLQPRSPGELGMCSYREFDREVEKARAKAEKQEAQSQD